jgi:hypothetical protein
MPITLSEAHKDSFKQGIKDMHNIFKEKVIYWEKPLEIINSASFDVENPDEYNHLYGKRQLKRNDEITYQPVSGEIYARVLFVNGLGNNKNTFAVGELGGARAEALVQENMIRVKVSNDDYAKIQNAIKYTIRGFDCEVVTTDRHHGFFGTEFHTLWMTRIK